MGTILRILTFSVVLLGIYLYAVTKTGLHQSYKCSMLGICPEIVIEGNIAPGFENVKSLFRHHYEIGEEVSSCVIAYLKEEKIVDLCGGFSDSGRPYREAVQIIFSSTKAVCSIVMNMLIDRGLLDYEDKVSKHWPEFAQGGKENVTVLDLLQHAGGLAWLDEPIDLELHSDLDFIAKRYAEQKHNFDSVRKQAYHAITYAFPLNELVRRVDPKKRTIGQFVREEINKPLGTEIFIGLREEEIATVWPRFSKFLEGSLRYYLFKEALQGRFEFFKINRDLFMKTVTPVRVKDSENTRNTLEYFKVEIGAANGLSNAESLARLAAAMANKGTFKGVRILSKQVAERSIELHPSELDYIINMNFTRTTGGFAQFILNKTDPHSHPVYGWAGYGGSFILWDPEAEIGFSYVMNAGNPALMGGRGANLLLAIQQTVYQKK